MTRELQGKTKGFPCIHKHTNKDQVKEDIDKPLGSTRPTYAGRRLVWLALFVP